jgi:hypothetical protein
MRTDRPCIPDSHPYRVTSTKCRIDTIISPDYGHIVARNMYRKEINILRKLCTKLALFTRLYKDALPTKRKIADRIYCNVHDRYFEAGCKQTKVCVVYTTLVAGTKTYR